MKNSSGIVDRPRLILVGSVFGALFALYEMIMGYVPMVWRWSSTRVYGEELLLTAAFHVLFFSVLSLPTLLLPRRLRKIEWMLLYYFAAVGVITLLGSQWVGIVVVMRFVSATFALVTLYGAVKLWRSGGRVRRFGIVTACLVAGMIPFALIAFGSKVPEASEASSFKAGEGKPNIVFVVYDTVNRDHLSAYGYARNTAPAFDKVARSGVRFDRIYTTSNWTVPSHASMFTGRFSTANGATHERPYLDESEVTLAEHLGSRGYQTAAFSCNPWVGEGTGFQQGFQVFKEMWRGFYRDEVYLLHRFWSVYFNRKKDKGGALLLEAVRDWTAGVDHKRPYFLFLNLMEAHTPYHQLPDEYAGMYLDGKLTKPEMARIGADSVALQLFWRTEPLGAGELGSAKAMYDGGIYYDDVIAGKVLDTLRAKGLLGNTIVIFITDHGELFGEQGLYGHEVSLYEPLTHIAMAMAWEGRIPPGSIIETPVSVNDLFPTIHDLAGLGGDVPGSIQGRSITNLLAGRPQPESLRVAESFKPVHLILSWRYNHPFQDPPGIIGERWQALWEEDLKVIKIMDDSGRTVKEMLFDLAADPEERIDLGSDRPGDLERLEKKLEGWREDMKGEAGEHAGSSVPKFDEETKERLRNLGYVESK
jgi:arylsulfatase A-like enzyme